MLKKHTIIVAGGSGTRMGSEEPKQFLKILGKPILAYTLEAFFSFDPIITIVLVLPETQIQKWERLKKECNITVPHQICVGGATRFHSVKNGLELVSENSIVAIHDGVRPFVSIETLKRCFEKAEKLGNAIPSIPVADSLRILSDNSSKAVNRSSFVAIQTPQCFRSEYLKDAYLQNYREDFTDDASVLESAGHTINLTDGNKENIKITTPSDLIIAEAFAKALQNI
jgi:2-C-methyl-D-erythritol 4-phosphate cytidylyltransferase